MHSLASEVRIIISFLLYGIFLFASCDAIELFYSRSKISKISKIVILFLLYGIYIGIAYQFAFYLCQGYFPIYFILFFGFGSLIYFVFFRQRQKMIIKKVLVFSSDFFQKRKKMFLSLFYSRELVSMTKKVILHFQKRIKMKTQKEKKEKK